MTHKNTPPACGKIYSTLTSTEMEAYSWLAKMNRSLASL